MTWAPTELQKSLYSLFINDSALQTLLGGSPASPRIYDFVPDDSGYPFVVLNFQPFADRGNTTSEGLQVKIQIDIFHRSNARGKKPVQLLQAEAHRILHNKDITITGWSIISLRSDYSDILTEEDNVTKHGVQIFNLLIGEV